MKIRSFLLMVMLLAGSNTSLIAAAGCCKCIPIKQKCKNNIPTPSVFTITNSGNYALKGDFKGSIVIAASDVTLDLCSFKVTGIDPNTAAIASKGSFNNITIKNGSVTNPSGLGIGVANSTGIVLENLDIFDSNQALTMTNCKSSQVTVLNAYQNTNTKNPLVTITGSDTIQLTQVQANNNTMAFAASPIKAIAQRAKKNKITSSAAQLQIPAILFLSDSSNVTLTECTANFNTCTRDSGFGQFFVEFCQSVSLINCQTNDNQISVADSQGFAPIFLIECTDTVIDSSQANRNQLGKTTAFLRPIFVLDSNRTIIKNSQVNDNTVKLLALNGTNNQDLSGIVIQNSDPVITHCQVSGNVVVDGGSGRNSTTSGFGQLNGIYILGSVGFPNRSVVEYCQVIDNRMESSNNKFVNQSVAGINIAASEDITVSNCSADGNQGGFSSFGIAANDGSNFFSGKGVVGSSRNIKVVNSTANNLSSSEQTAGIIFYGSPGSASIPATPVQFSEIVGCQANGNIGTSKTGNGGGIKLFNVQSCSINDCQTDKNSTDGILAQSGVSFVNSDCAILNCSAKENQNGFSIGLRCSHFLMKDNIAIGNIVFGFSDGNKSSRYLGNYASNPQATTANFGVANIQIFRLDSTGFYHHVAGDPVHFSSLANVEAQPK